MGGFSFEEKGSYSTMMQLTGQLASQTPQSMH
jgi:hypothetical protein